MSIPRYMIVTYPDPDGHCGTTEEQPWDAGRFVLYADHLADREALLAVLRRAEDVVDGLLDGLDANHDEREGLTNDQWDARVDDARVFLAAARAVLEEEKT